MPAENSNADVKIFVDVISNYKKNIDMIKKGINKGMISASKGVGLLTDQYGRLDKALAAQERHVMGPKKAFQGWAMSIMLAGMAIKQAMTTIWQTSSKTFNDVMHSTEGTVTGFDRLQGSLTYLWFTAGQALEPLAQMLIPIVDYIAQIIEDHPDAFRWAVAGSTIFGSIAFALGSITLAMSGFQQALTILGTVVSATVGWIFALFAGFFLLVINNFANVQGYMSSTFGLFYNLSKSVIEGVIGFFGGLWKVIKGIFTLNFPLVWEGFMDMLKVSITTIAKFVTGIVYIALNMVINIVNSVTTIVMNMVISIGNGLLFLAELANNIPGVSIGTSGLENTIAKLESFKNSIQLAQVSPDNLLSTNKTIDSALGVNQTTEISGPITLNVYNPNNFDANVLLAQLQSRAG